MTAHSNGNRNVVIETHNLTKYFGSRKAVDALTMAVPRGSVFAFLGRNGSGKTTTIRMLLGLTEPTRGSSRILGHDSQSLSPEVRARIGYMSESHSLYDSLMDARRQAGEGVVPFHKFADLVKEQTQRLKKKGSEEVTFSVTTTDGRVNLTAKGSKQSG